MDFGQLLLAHRLVTPEQLEEALSAQRRSILQGEEPVPRLGEIFVKSGILTEQQVVSVLRSQQKAILSCPRCLIQVNVDLRPDVAAYRCSTCQGELVMPPELHDVRVQDHSSAIFVSREPLPEGVTQAAQDPARKFGKYILLEEIGRGGMAIVHRAWDTYLNQYVALKVLRANAFAPLPPGQPDDRIHRLLKEARNAIRMRHPNIVTVHDVGRLEKLFYMAMDCLEGRTLAELIRDSRDHLTPLYQDPRRMLYILRDVARAVHYAHTRHVPIIHCDLKPSNIFIDHAGKSFILDFGLARHLDPTITSSSNVMRGTPAYMSPEQASGNPDEIDARTDVYALGGILYELLAGRPPFSGSDLELLHRAKRDTPPPPLTLRPPLSDSERAYQARYWSPLEEISLRALRKERAERYASASELADAFDRILKSSTARVKSIPQAPAIVSAKAVAVPTETVPMNRIRFTPRRIGILTTFIGAFVLLTLLGLWLRRHPSGENHILTELQTLRQRVETQLASLQGEQARQTLTEAIVLVPLEEKRWLEDTLEDAESLIVMRERLIQALNSTRRYATSNFRLRDRELHAVEVLRATPTKLVLFVEGRTAEVPWSGVSPQAIIAMITDVFLANQDGRAEDRLALGLYCEKNGLFEMARTHFQALQGTALEVVARRHLARPEFRVTPPSD